MKCHLLHHSQFQNDGHVEVLWVPKFILKRMQHRMSKRLVFYAGFCLIVLLLLLIYMTSSTSCAVSKASLTSYWLNNYQMLLTRKCLFCYKCVGIMCDIFLYLQYWLRVVVTWCSNVCAMYRLCQKITRPWLHCQRQLLKMYFSCTWMTMSAGDDYYYKTHLVT